jgi:hypothetical protein
MPTAAASRADPVVGGPSYVHWGPIIGGAIVAAAVSFVLITFGAAIGLSIASPSPTWRDTSAMLTLLSGIWVLVVAIGSFALGGYIAGRTRFGWAGAGEDEVEFRDGVHGLLVWGLAVIIAILLEIAAANVAASAAARAAGPMSPSHGSPSNTEPFLALELDRLFRSDRPGERVDAETRAEASRIISTGLGRRDIAGDDRTYLMRLVSAKTGLSPADAERRTNEVIGQAKQAASQARRSAVIIAFMTASAMAAAAAVAWFAAGIGGRHRDHGGAPSFWVHGRRIKTNLAR